MGCLLSLCHRLVGTSSPTSRNCEKGRMLPSSACRFGACSLAGGIVPIGQPNACTAKVGTMRPTRSEYERDESPPPFLISRRTSHWATRNTRGLERQNGMVLRDAPPTEWRTHWSTPCVRLGRARPKQLSERPPSATSEEYQLEAQAK